MATLARSQPVNDNPFRRILGVEFFGGSGQEAFARIRKGGLLVVPAAPALRNLARDEPYREALLNSDLCITDSAFMVMIWNISRHDKLGRLSGLSYLRALLEEPEIRLAGSTLWIMASCSSGRRHLEWLAGRGVVVPEQYVHVAPMYGDTIEDGELLRKLLLLRPRHVVVTLGGGVQERLGLYLKRNLDYLPAIHCIGAAIAFLSGDQVRIPRWADSFRLGFLFRCGSNPQLFLPRYWHARKLLGLMMKYRGELPPLERSNV